MKILSENQINLMLRVIKVLDNRDLQVGMDEIFDIVYANNRELEALAIMAKNNYEIRLEGGE